LFDWSPPFGVPIAHLVSDLKQLIQEARRLAAAKVNAELSLLYWRVGQRIRTEILDKERAAYGQQILETLSTKLTEQFGRGWSERQLRYCVRFAEVYPDSEILHTLCAKLTWSHIRQLVYLDDDLKREFYIEMCHLERWSVRQLAERTQSMLYENEVSVFGVDRCGVDRIGISVDRLVEIFVDHLGDVAHGIVLNQASRAQGL
jgi:DUF1016 N-terminal domain